MDLVIAGIIILFIVLVVGILLSSACSKPKVVEGYRDPLYLNRAKFVYDWYPRANGSIYGRPYMYGGSWSMFTGYPYYPRAY